jgi:serine/threonine protein kinase
LHFYYFCAIIAASKEGGIFMQIINMSKTKLNSLEPLILPKNVTSTECELFKYPYYGKEKLLKKLHRTDGIIFANKLYTIEALNANKDSMPSNFVLPESLVSINKKIEAFTMKYIKGINLSVILNNPDITYEEKIHYLKSIGRILEQMQNIRKYTNLNNFYLGDIHEDNFLVERDKQEIYIVDLDSCKIAGNKSFPGRYLTNSSLIKYNNTKYQTLSQTDDLADYKIDENTDIYCYIIMILNYLYDGRVDRLSLDKFYDFINYLEDIKVNIELIECFNKIVVGGNNINPCNYLDTLTPKQVAGARRLYKKK